jgi:hypothetical protein
LDEPGLGRARSRINQAGKTAGHVKSVKPPAGNKRTTKAPGVVDDSGIDWIIDQVPTDKHKAGIEDIKRQLKQKLLNHIGAATV